MGRLETDSCVVMGPKVRGMLKGLLESTLEEPRREVREAT
jgi:hypothetical protein